MPGPTTTGGIRPQLSAVEIARVALDGYGLRVVEQRQLGGEVDQNVWVRTTDGTEFLLKATAGVVDSILRWQQTVLTHLEHTAPDIPVPRLVPTRSGDTMMTCAAAGRSIVVRMLTWMPGKMLADLPSVPDHLLFELGTVAARLTQALDDLPSESAPSSHHWDIRKARETVDEALSFAPDEGDRRAVTELMERFDRARPLLSDLPSGVVHHDLNDFNVLATTDAQDRWAISGVIDVNDSIFSIRVAELAIAVAYGMLRQNDPIQAASSVVAGFNALCPLTEQEVTVVFPLACARLCVNATTWTRRTSETDHPYGLERMQHTWPTVRQLAAIPLTTAQTRLRAACGFPALALGSPEGTTIMISDQLAPVFADRADLTEVDLGPEAEVFDERCWSDPEQVAAGLEELLGDRTARRGFTRHLSPSMLRTGRRRPGAEEPATVQLGIRMMAREGARAHAPLAGVVVRAGADGSLVLRHSGSQGDFWTRWRGLDPIVEIGSAVRGGDPLGTVRAARDDRDLGATLLVQVLVQQEQVDAPPPEWCRVGELEKWLHLTADPAPLLGLGVGTALAMNAEAVVSLRDRRLARSQRAYYRRPPKFVRGRGVWLYDEYARGYLDAINNVTHVGHAEPRISAAATRQIRKLNTNSRFIYEGLATYADRLVATLPAPLEVAFLVCTGSEANDLALRMARQVTGRTDVMVIDGAYHGNTAAVMGISPNRYKGPGGGGAPPTTHEVMCPDTYRGPYGRDDVLAGHKYGADVERVAGALVAESRPPAAFIAESLMGTAGNIVFPEGYLQRAFAAARGAGALCISDEVQVGVGRLGTHFWGFEAHGVIPDIVTMGKPLGNGHPVAAVVTTREIADAFDDGVKYFNTFAGNPVSCAIGTAVLDIVEEDDLRGNALTVGRYLLRSLQELQGRHALIGDVRGHGLYVGIELVSDPLTKNPAAAAALAVSELMMQHGVIVYPTGARDNVLKIKPPMVFGLTEVDLFVSTLDLVLTTLTDPVEAR